MGLALGHVRVGLGGLLQEAQGRKGERLGLQMRGSASLDSVLRAVRYRPTEEGGKVKDLASAADTTMQAQAQTVREALAVASRNCKTIIDGKRSLAGRAALDALVAELDRLRDTPAARRAERSERDRAHMAMQLAEARAELERVTLSRSIEAAEGNRVRADLHTAWAELERVTREREIDAIEHRGTCEFWKRKYEGAEAELVAAAGREQRLRDAAQPVVNALDAYASVGGVDLETLRAVLEEGQQP